MNEKLRRKPNVDELHLKTLRGELRSKGNARCDFLKQAIQNEIAMAGSEYHRVEKLRHVDK